MEITEVRVKLVARSRERLRAFCSITLDGDFVIRDLKIIDGTNGAFVAMPSRKLADRCPRCGCKNHLRAKYCSECSQKLNENRAPRDAQGRAKLHADVAHPINAACRERIQKAVTQAYHAELERAKSPDYKPPDYDDFQMDDDLVDEEPPEPVRPATAETGPAARPPDRGEQKDAGDADFSDYNSLISDLKRDAEDRRRKQQQRSSAAMGSVAVESARDAPPEAAGDLQEQPQSREQATQRDDRPATGDSGRPEAGEQAVANGRARADRDSGESEPPADHPDASTAPSPGAAPKPPPPPTQQEQEDEDAFGAGLF